MRNFIGQFFRMIPPSSSWPSSIRRNGVLDPLVITADRFVVSGHRRYVAAQLAGAVTVPCHVLEFRRVDDIDRFVSLLREHNRQRDKSLDEKLREELISVDPDEAYASLLEARRPPIHYIDAVHIEGRKVRHGISAAKADHVRYIKEVLFQRLRTYWPVTVRKVHYELLNFDFLRNISKELRVYVNDDHSYKATSNLCTRSAIRWCDSLGGVDGRNATVQFVASLSRSAAVHARAS